MTPSELQKILYSLRAAAVSLADLEAAGFSFADMKARGCSEHERDERPYRQTCRQSTLAEIKLEDGKSAEPCRQPWAMVATHRQFSMEHGHHDTCERSESSHAQWQQCCSATRSMQFEIECRPRSIARSSALCEPAHLRQPSTATLKHLINEGGIMGARVGAPGWQDSRRDDLYTARRAVDGDTWHGDCRLHRNR